VDRRALSPIDGTIAIGFGHGDSSLSGIAPGIALGIAIRGAIGRVADHQ
jgi:hypothetical protein